MGRNGKNASRSRFGTCHICLEEKKLTYEHVPPRRAYNHVPVLAQTFNPPFSRETNLPLGIPVMYRAGMGCHTLCENCNGFTAKHYGPAFADWVKQAMVFAANYDSVDGRDNAILLPFTIEPLAVLKQIATMTLAVADLSGNDALWGLRRFVLTPGEPLVVRDVTFRVYLNPKRSSWTPPQSRMNGVGVITDTRHGTSTHTIADIAFPPLGYWTAWNRHPRRALSGFSTLADVTHFGRFSDRRERTVWLRMPVRLPFGPILFREQYGNE